MQRSTHACGPLCTALLAATTTLATPPANDNCASPTQFDGLSLHDVVDEAVLECFGRGEPPVAVGIGLDLLDRLAGVFGDQVRHRALDVQGLYGLNANVGRGAAQPA